MEIAYLSSKMKNDHHAHNSPAWCDCSIQLATIRGFQIDHCVKKDSRMIRGVMEANIEIAYISSKMKNDRHAHKNSPAWCGNNIQLWQEH